MQMTAKRYALAAAAAALVGVPVVAAAAQDAPLGGVRVAAFFGPSNCDGNAPRARPRLPRCTFRPIDVTVLVADTSSGRVVARLRTGNDGRGGVRLGEGDYTLRSGQPHDVFATPPQPKRVMLAAGQVADAILDFDPGDR